VTKQGHLPVSGALCQSRLLPVVLYVNNWVRIQIRHTFSFPIRSATHMYLGSCYSLSTVPLCSLLHSLFDTLHFLFFKLFISRICITHFFYRSVLYGRDKSVSIVTMLGAMHLKNTSPLQIACGVQPVSSLTPRCL
jgi:hypothetical protein